MRKFEYSYNARVVNADSLITIIPADPLFIVMDNFIKKYVSDLSFRESVVVTPGFLEFVIMAAYENPDIEYIPENLIGVKEEFLSKWKPTIEIPIGIDHKEQEESEYEQPELNAKGITNPGEVALRPTSVSAVMKKALMHNREDGGACVDAVIEEYLIDPIGPPPPCPEYLYFYAAGPKNFKEIMDEFKVMIRENKSDLSDIFKVYTGAKIKIDILVPEVKKGYLICAENDIVARNEKGESINITLDNKRDGDYIEINDFRAKDEYEVVLDLKDVDSIITIQPNSFTYYLHSQEMNLVSFSGNGIIIPASDIGDDSSCNTLFAGKMNANPSVYSASMAGQLHARVDQKTFTFLSKFVSTSQLIKIDRDFTDTLRMNRLETRSTDKLDQENVDAFNGTSEYIFLYSMPLVGENSLAESFRNLREKSLNCKNKKGN